MGERLCNVDFSFLPMALVSSVKNYLYSFAFYGPTSNCSCVLLIRILVRWCENNKILRGVISVVGVSKSPINQHKDFQTNCYTCNQPKKSMFS